MASTCIWQTANNRFICRTLLLSYCCHIEIAQLSELLNRVRFVFLFIQFLYFKLSDFLQWSKYFNTQHSEENTKCNIIWRQFRGSSLKLIINYTRTLSDRLLYCIESLRYQNVHRPIEFTLIPRFHKHIHNECKWTTYVRNFSQFFSCVFFSVFYFVCC